jgi:hypothetical protein
MSPVKKMSDASGSTPHSRRASLQSKPTTPYSVQQRAKSVPHEATRAVIGELQLQPHPPRTTHGVGHRQPGGRTKQGEAMSRLAAPPRRSPRPQQQLSPGMSGMKPKGPNISLLQIGQPSPERAVDPPSVALIPAPKSVDRVKFLPVPPLDPVQHLSRPQRSQANKKAVPGKKGPSGSDPAKLSISVKAAPGRKKQAMQLFITAAPLSIDNVPDSHASNFSSPYLQAAAGYNYEADDYEVDYEIFSVNPGAKLPLLGAALAVSASPVPETHRLEEPSMSSRSICRTFNDDSACVLDELMVTAPERKMNIFDVKRSASRESFSLDNSCALPGVPGFSKESDARKVVLEVEVPTSSYLSPGQVIPKKVSTTTASLMAVSVGGITMWMRMWRGRVTISMRMRLTPLSRRRLLLLLRSLFSMWVLARDRDRERVLYRARGARATGTNGACTASSTLVRTPQCV